MPGSLLRGLWKTGVAERDPQVYAAAPPQVQGSETPLQEMHRGRDMRLFPEGTPIPLCNHATFLIAAPRTCPTCLNPLQHVAEYLI